MKYTRRHAVVHDTLHCDMDPVCYNGIVARIKHQYKHENLPKYQLKYNAH